MPRDFPRDSRGPGLEMGHVLRIARRDLRPTRVARHGTVGDTAMRSVLGAALALVLAGCTLAIPLDEYNAGDNRDAGASLPCIDAGQGKCQPVTIFKNDPSAGTWGTLGELAFDGQRLFVGDVGDQGQSGLTGALWSVSRDGSDVVRLDPPGTTEVGAIAFDGASVFWAAQDGTVNRVGKGGGSVTKLATEPSGSLRGVAVQGNHVFYGAGTVVKQLYLVGGSSFPITPDLPTPGAVASSGSYVYFATAGNYPDFTNGSISRVPVDLTSPPSQAMKPVETLAANQNYPSGMALDASHVYWTTGDGTLHRMKLDGSEPTTLATATEEPDSGPQRIALDEKYVYWSTWGTCVQAAGCSGKPLRGRVQRVAKTGGTKEVLFDGGYLPTGIAVDATSVYFTTWWMESALIRLAL